MRKRSCRVRPRPDLTDQSAQPGGAVQGSPTGPSAASREAVHLTAPAGEATRHCQRFDPSRRRLGVHLECLGVDVGTGIAILGPSAITLKLLGPTADYVGEGVKSWAQHRVENVQRIFNAAEYKLDQDVLSEPGAVSPRVLTGILDEGSFREDEVGVEYFAGVLATSRSRGGYDDRGATAIAVLDGMSTFQLRAHYVLYRAAQVVAARHPEVNWYSWSTRGRVTQLAVPTETFLRTLFVREQSKPSRKAAFVHALNGLERLGLIDADWSVGTPDELRREMREMRAVDWPTKCVAFGTSDFGVELFCAAHGFHVSPLDEFKRPSSEFDARWRTDVPPCDAIVIDDLPPLDRPQDDM
jgi:hypothetical protein